MIPVCVSGKQRDLNMYAVYLQTVRACLTSVSTLTCALAIKYVEAEWRFYVDSVIKSVLLSFCVQFLLEIYEQCGLSFLCNNFTRLEVEWLFWYVAAL